MTTALPDVLPSLEEVRAEICVRSLREFVHQAWPIIEPATPFKSNWHIDVICEHLEAVTAGEIRRLLINIPPRHMKSSTTAVMWPAWSWLQKPHLRWLFASYAEKLSKRDSIATRRIIESRGGRLEGGTLMERVGYQGILRLLDKDWSLSKDQNEKLRFQNTEMGYRLATSVDGQGTGEGGDIIVIDDPHNAKEVLSDVQRQDVIEWFDGTMSSRLNDPTTGAFVIVMQRLHEQDLAGHVLDRGGYTHLCLPAEYEPTHPFVWPDDPRTEPGDLLWPDHFTRPALNSLKTDMGSYRAAGQLQQRPAPAEGGILKTAWWQYYPPSMLDDLDASLELDDHIPRWAGPKVQGLICSWDTTLKEKTSSDYAVGQLWAYCGPDRYLLRSHHERMGLTNTITAVKAMVEWANERFPDVTPRVVIENKANGPEVISAIKKKVPGVIPSNPSTDKVTRAEAITPQLEAGNVYVPGDRVMSAAGWTPDPVATPAWVQELIAECASFPNAANDDQVDALTQALDPRRSVSSSKRTRSGKGGTVVKR
jgi:predicted phage terminase large subunit-like protein